MSQTSVTAGGQSIGVAGQIADSMDANDIVSGFSQDTAQIPFGYGLVRGPANDGFVLPTGPSGSIDISGLSVWSADHSPAGLADPGGRFSGDIGASGLLPNSSLQVGRRGRFLVPVETPNPINGDRAWCRIAATGALTPGSWVGTNLAASYVTDCRNQGIFRSGTFTAADGTTKVAILECDFRAEGFMRP